MTKTEIYDMICRTLTDYEEGECNENDLYSALCTVTNHWEDVITAEE